MGLKARKIKSMIEQVHDEYAADVNAKLGTQFTFEVDWALIPDDIDGWNWEDDDLKLVYYNSFFLPIHETLPELFEDDMYKEEIMKQVINFKFEAGRKMVADFDFADGTLFIKNTLCVNQKNPQGMYIDSAKKDLTKCIESKLG